MKYWVFTVPSLSCAVAAVVTDTRVCELRTWLVCPRPLAPDADQR
jgi:hypothetical protein